VAGRAGVKVERPERGENDDLDPGEGRRRLKQRRQRLGHRSGITSGGLVGRWRARVSSLISVLGPVSGDMMGDRVPARGGCGRSFYGGRPRGVH
jgi:hypothetical protein